MKIVTHKKQQNIWDKEHKKPYALLQMDSQDSSSGVVKVFDWLKAKSKMKNFKAVEFGCGKGRNVIWLAKQGVEVVGIDFSPVAIKEAKRRAKLTGINKTRFFVHDATKTWSFKSNSFDFAIDCFATTDIESIKGREFAVKEILRILKPSGYLFVYSLSTDDEFHKEMVKISPAKEKNAFINPKTGKFEKTFDRKELINLHKNLKLIVEKRIEKTAVFFGKKYKCKHHWMIFQKKS